MADIERARFMAFGPDGTLFISLPDAGQIKACRDENGDGFYEKMAIFVKDHRTVQGLFWHDGWLWFSESGAIFKARDTNGDGVADEQQAVIPEGQLPKGGHWWRSILIHNGRLYTSIGDSGNITDETGTDRQKIWTYSLDGKDKKLFISGIRNTEKLVVRPGTDEIWGMDHGSDWFGREIEGENNPHGQPITDLNPPDEMNLYIEGGFYGHPFVVGNKVPRYEYMKRPDIVELAAGTIPPAWSTGAHWAPNAMTFYTGKQFPEEYRGDALRCLPRLMEPSATRGLLRHARPVRPGPTLRRVDLCELPDEPGEGPRPAGGRRRRSRRLAVDQRRRKGTYLPPELHGETDAIGKGRSHGGIVLFPNLLTAAVIKTEYARTTGSEELFLTATLFVTGLGRRRR